MSIVYPKLHLLDLDDTILVFDGVAHASWMEICRKHAYTASVHPDVLYKEIMNVGSAYWSDPARHRAGRLALDATRRTLTGEALANLGVTDKELAITIADEYTALREESMHPFPGAIDALRFLGTRSILCLVTNGESHKQRAKIERFNLARHFEHIFIEEEMGFGKPDERVFEHILRLTGFSPAETWMTGDNLEWDIAAPQKLGIFAIWNDWRREGLPSDSPVKPDRIIHSIAEMREQESLQKS